MHKIKEIVYGQPVYPNLWTETEVWGRVRSGGTISEGVTRVRLNYKDGGVGVTDQITTGLK